MGEPPLYFWITMSVVWLVLIFAALITWGGPKR